METKVFFLTSNYYPPYHVGGACIHVYHLANALAALGHEVHVIYSLDWYYFKKGRIEPKEGYSNDENVFLHPVKSPLRSLTPLAAYILGSYYPLSGNILRTIKNTKPDVIHHHNITGFGPFILEAKADKVIYTAHDYWLVCPTFSLLKYNKTPCIYPENCSICSIFSQKPPQVWRYGTDMKKMTKNIDTIISPSEYMRHELKRLGISKKIEVIPNFVEIDKLGKQHDFMMPYLLYAGRLEYNKGIIKLIESFYEVLKKTEYHLIIAGDGSLRNKVKAMTESKQSQERIHYLGEQDQSVLSKLYESASAVIIPSVVPENCPLVALESISHGIPIIATRSGGLTEIIQTTRAGVLVENRNAFELQNDLIRIINDEDLLEKSRKNAMTFNKYYSKENYMKKYSVLINHD